MVKMERCHPAKDFAWYLSHTSTLPFYKRYLSSRETLQSSCLFPIPFSIYAYIQWVMKSCPLSYPVSHKICLFIPTTPDLVWLLWLLNESPCFMLFPPTLLSPRSIFLKHPLRMSLPERPERQTWGQTSQATVMYHDSTRLGHELLRLGKELLIKWKHPPSKKLCWSYKIHSYYEGEVI